MDFIKKLWNWIVAWFKEDTIPFTKPVAKPTPAKVASAKEVAEKLVPFKDFVWTEKEYQEYMLGPDNKEDRIDYYRAIIGDGTNFPVRMSMSEYKYWNSRGLKDAERLLHQLSPAQRRATNGMKRSK